MKSFLQDLNEQKREHLLNLQESQETEVYNQFGISQDSKLQVIIKSITINNVTIPLPVELYASV